METLHTSRKVKGLSRKERRLIKRQNATIQKNRKRKRRIVVTEPESEQPKSLISKEIMENIQRILKEFKPKKEFCFVPVGIYTTNHCSYGLMAHHGKPTPQVTEITYCEYEE